MFVHLQRESWTPSHQAQLRLVVPARLLQLSVPFGSCSPAYPELPLNLQSAAQVATGQSNHHINGTPRIVSSVTYVLQIRGGT